MSYAYTYLGRPVEVIPNKNADILKIGDRFVRVVKKTKPRKPALRLIISR